MSLVRMGTWAMVIACCLMANMVVLSTTRGMGWSALRGTVCHLGIAELLCATSDLAALLTRLLGSP